MASTVDFRGVGEAAADANRRGAEMSPGLGMGRWAGGFAEHGDVQENQ